jgi:uncharacterized protein
VSSRVERIVLDTNVLVSALLNPSGAPAQVLTLVLASELRLVFDRRILDEYAEVLARPRFGLDPADVAEVLRQLEADGERVAATASAVALPDADDLPFLEVALSGPADAQGRAIARPQAAAAVPSASTRRRLGSPESGARCHRRHRAPSALRAPAQHEQAHSRVALLGGSGRRRLSRRRRRSSETLSRRCRPCPPSAGARRR